MLEIVGHPVVVNLILTAGAFVVCGFAVQALAGGVIGVGLGAVITLATCVVSLRGISSRLGDGHRIVKLAIRFPGGRLVCGV